jgi:ATP-binding cassette subfamily B protein
MMEEEEEKYQLSVPDRALFVRMIRYVFRYPKRAIILLIAVIFSTLLNLAPPFMFSLAIDTYITDLDVRGLGILALAFISVYGLTFGVQFIQRFLINWLGTRMEYDIRIDLFHHLQRLSLSFYTKREVGSITSRVTNDIDKIAELVTSGLATVVVDLLTLIGIISIMLLMNTQLSLITFTVFPIMIGFMYLWGKRVRSVYRKTRRTIASVSAKMEESVSGMREIQSFSREGETRREFQQINISNMQANVQAGQVMSAFWPAVSFFTAIGTFLVLWFGGIAVMEGTLTVGILFGFMSYLNRFFQPIQELSMFWNNVQSALAGAERVFQILDTEIDVKNRKEVLEPTELKGEIVFEKVSFNYDPNKPVLKDISFTIEENSTVALVGPTGAGKTTISNLIYRFYDPKQGRIIIDGYDLREIKLETLRQKMAIVLQDPYLFSGTVLENIKYGNPKASIEEIITVSKRVGAHDFIEALPKGYGTIVRERGGRLSMGQRQLISLARALITNPRILVMDEATSSIDPYTELIIKEAIEKILKNRTSIIIAHRLSTVRNADKIIVLKEGKIVDVGNHEELMEREGLYSKLYKMQFTSETIKELTP